MIPSVRRRTWSLGVDFREFELGQTLSGFWWVFVEESGAEVAVFS